MVAEPDVAVVARLTRRGHFCRINVLDSPMAADLPPSSPRRIMHVDMDAFFAAVEQRDRPELRGKPVIVGGTQGRGVVATASYEVRPYGVGSAMSMTEAMRRCPHAIVVAPRPAVYHAVSQGVFKIFHRYTPLVEGLSLDEAFLDITASRELFGDGLTIAERVRHDIYSELQLTASAGVAPNKFVAKIASEMNKPNGVTVVPEPVADFLAPLPIERMWGVGRVAAQRLRVHGIHTFGDLCRWPADDLVTLFGDWGAHLRLLAQGIDSRPVTIDHGAKSISVEETFPVDCNEDSELRRRLLGQAERLASRLHAKGLQGRCITLKVKYSDFELVNRSHTQAAPVSDARTLYRTACDLLARMPRSGSAVRLTGVAISQFESSQTQLFVDQDIKLAEQLEHVKAKIRDRYGQASVGPASLLRRRWENS